ncbi:ABC transporter ATP-binding protein [Myxococcota bacterium]|nr:ABC transporter ATP-binding protein [Myxococcota bacterium]
MGEVLLEVSDLSVSFVTEDGLVRALDRVSLELRRGEVVGLAGESGSGKSTFARALMRVLAPPAVITGGRVIFEGRDVLAMGEEELRRFRWARVAMVYQSAMDALNPVATIGAQLEDAILAHEHVGADALRERVGALLTLVGMDAARRHSYPHTLSGGMRQRVVIAMALALRPPLLIMDEPTTALDVVVQRDILQQISKLRREMGFSVLFITHDLPLMLELCDHIGILYAGRLAELAPSKIIRTGAAHPYTRGLMRAFPPLTGPRIPLEGIPGSPPSLVSPPTGCRFHPRCGLVEPKCREVQPELVTLGPAHHAACHVARGP